MIRLPSLERACGSPTCILIAAFTLLGAACDTASTTADIDGTKSTAKRDTSNPPADSASESLHEPPTGKTLAGTPGSADLAASSLASVVDCDRSKAGRAVAQLEWQGSQQAGDEQRVAVTIYGNGFETGQFEISDPIPAGQTSFTWDRLKGQAFHSWRVVTLRNGVWVPSQTARFEGPTCVGGSKLEDPHRKVQP